MVFRGLDLILKDPLFDRIGRFGKGVLEAFHVGLFKGDSVSKGGDFISCDLGSGDVAGGSDPLTKEDAFDRSGVAVFGLDQADLNEKLFQGRAKKVLIEGGGHALHIDHWEEWDQAVRQFLGTGH